MVFGKIKCSRCGKELQPFSGRYRYVTILLNAPVKHFILCDECYEKFMDAVNEFLECKKEGGKGFGSYVAKKSREEVEKLIKSIREIDKHSVLYVLRGASSGGYITGMFYALHVYNNTTFKENFTRVINALYKRMKDEYEAISWIMGSHLKFGEPLVCFMRGFLSALRDVMKNEDLSDEEVKDIKDAMKEKRIGRTKKFSGAEDALRWLKGDESDEQV